jgi:hypothetical protein
MNGSHVRGEQKTAASFDLDAHLAGTSRGTTVRSDKKTSPW